MDAALILQSFGTSPERLEKLFLENSHFENGERVARPAELAEIMKRVGRSPYMFISNAIVESAKKNYIGAESWVEYARQFETPFFDDPLEKEYFALIADMTMSWLAVIQHVEKAEGQE